VYRTNGNSDALARLAKGLRETILPREAGDRLVIPRFSVGRANVLFENLVGPAASRLVSAKRVIVDPTGPLQIVPIGVLVTDRRNVEAYVARTRQDKNSYEDVAFLARNTEIATALSPRSFLAARKQAPSTAPNRFIGFGEHRLPTEDLLNAITPFSTATGCSVDGQGLANSYYQPAISPISSEELRIAAAELNDPGAPIVTGDQFTDRGLSERSDLAQYGVIHFATHGFVEGNWLDCQKSPPSLLTSLSPSGSDGVLTIDEIARLKLDANLVFLAACDTAAGVEDKDLARASGQEEAGGSLEGLVRAFLTANARAVVATSWVAPDGETTLRLVRTFYATGKTSSIGAALRQGQLSLMNDPAASHPYRWGSFFVVGDASKSMLSANRIISPTSSKQ
jgi:CHAT domain-containing protein